MASIQKYSGNRGNTYRVMWRLPDGRQRSRSFKAHKDASAFRHEVETLERRRRGPDPQRGAISLHEWSEAFLGTLHLKPKTEETYRSLLRSRILPSLGDKRIDSLTRLDVQEWVAAMAVEVSASRVRNAHGLLNQMLAEAVRHERLLTNPAERIALPRVAKHEVHPLSRDQLLGVAARCGRYEPLVLWLGTMGTRWAETVGLRWEQVRDGVAIIDSSLSEVNGKFHRVSTKTYEVRRLPVPSLLLQRLERHDEGLVFRTTYGNPIRSARFRAEVFVPACRDVGVLGTRIHHLRHTCASLLIGEGANPKIVQQWLGHQDIRITMDTYAHLFDSDFSTVANRLDALLI